MERREKGRKTETNECDGGNCGVSERRGGGVEGERAVAGVGGLSRTGAAHI